MRKIFTLSFILFSGFTLAIANPRNFPNNNSGHNNAPSGNSNSPSSSNNNSPSNNNNHPNHGSNNYNNNNHGYNNYSNNYHGNQCGNYSYPRPVVVFPPRPVIVTRPVYVSRPVIQVNVPRPNYNYNEPSYQGFNFKDFMYTLKNQNFDSDKLSIARQALRNNFFDTYQIREVMSTMDFEKNRVEFAKDAYSNCVDKQNYFRVNDAFEFSSSIRELEDYIFASR
jgi:hypothetical protein